MDLVERRELVVTLELTFFLAFAASGLIAALSLGFFYSCYEKYYYFLAKNHNEIWWKYISLDPVVQVWVRKRDRLAESCYGPISSFSLMKSSLDTKEYCGDPEVLLLKRTARNHLRRFLIFGSVAFVLTIVMIVFE